jgi:hypothetical protein
MVRQDRAMTGISLFYSIMYRRITGALPYAG